MVTVTVMVMVKVMVTVTVDLPNGLPPVRQGVGGRPAVGDLALLAALLHQLPDLLPEGEVLLRLHLHRALLLP